MNTHQSTRTRLKNNCVSNEAHSFRQECRLMKIYCGQVGQPNLLWNPPTEGALAVDAVVANLVPL